MLPQPLPSGLSLHSSTPSISPPLSHPAPPPLPPPLPPRIVAAAFSAAAAAASHIHPARRCPTLHVIVVLASAPAPAALLRHAHHILLHLSSKGFHVFLHTEAELPSSATLAPLPHALLPDAIAASQADFVAILAEHHLPTQCVQVRLRRDADFLDMPVADLPAALFTAWTHRLRSVSARADPALPTNPNVVTAAHLDALLLSCAHLPSLRRSFARLQHLVHLTHDWLPASPTLPKRALAHDEHDDDDDDNDGKARRVRLHGALRHGLRAAARAHARVAPESWDSTRRAQFSFSWLRRSTTVPARVLRSQMLARTLHRDLLSALRRLSALPLAREGGSTAVAPTAAAAVAAAEKESAEGSASVPTDAHRCRLLREVNELLPRVEDLGARLSGRPRTRRRRKQFVAADPWSAYVASEGVEKGVLEAGVRKFVERGEEEGKKVERWRCCACMSCNEDKVMECQSCHMPCWRVDPQSSARNAELLNERFDDVLSHSQAIASSTPWIFTPGVVPMQSAQYETVGKDTTRETERTPRQSPARSPPRENDGLSHRQIKQYGVLPFRNGSKLQHRSQQDSTSRPRHHRTLFQNPRGANSNPSSSTRTGDSIAKRETYTSSMPMAQNVSLQSRSSNAIPIRHATSAPNGDSFTIDEVGRMIPKGSHHSHRALLHTRDLDKTPVRSIASSDEHIFNTMSHLTGSLPDSEVVPRTASYDSDQVTGSFLRNPFPSSRVQKASPQSEACKQIRIPKTASSQLDFGHAAMEELAVGSYEAGAEGPGGLLINRRAVSKPVPVPGASGTPESLHSEVTSLEVLAAASDAANGGTGSATMESLRAVSAVVTPGRNQKSDEHLNGVYNMF